MKDPPPILPGSSAFKTHSCTIPFRLTSNGCIESEPATGTQPRLEVIAPARLRYSTGVFRPELGPLNFRVADDPANDRNGSTSTASALSVNLTAKLPNF